MYRMEVWEAVKMYEGLIHRDRHLLEALRINTLMSVLPHTTEPMTTTDIIVYPWDEIETATAPSDEVDIDELKRLSQQVSQSINSN